MSPMNMLNVEKTSKVDHFVVNDHKDQVGAMFAISIYNIPNGIPPLRTGMEPTMRNHHEVF